MRFVLVRDNKILAILKVAESAILQAKILKILRESFLLQNLLGDFESFYFRQGVYDGLLLYKNMAVMLLWGEYIEHGSLRFSLGAVLLKILTHFEVSTNCCAHP